MQPLDEVRAAMTAFDETLFRVVPALYRSLDRALTGPASGQAAPAAPAFLRFGSWIGADRDGNPFVTPEVTGRRRVIQAEHVLRALENATARIGRCAHRGRRPHPGRAGPASAARSSGAAHAHPDLLAEITSPLAAGAVPRVPPLRRAAAARDPARPRRPAGWRAQAGSPYSGPAEFLADLRLVQQALAAGGRAPAGVSASCST